jgi:hypothetical protein
MGVYEVEVGGERKGWDGELGADGIWRGGGWWYRDVIAGAIVGILFSWYTYRQYYPVSVD